MATLKLYHLNIIVTSLAMYYVYIVHLLYKHPLYTNEFEFCMELKLFLTVASLYLCFIKYSAYE